MALGQQTAVYVYRYTAFLISFLAFDQIFSLPGFGKPEIFIGHHFGNGEAVVNLGNVNVCRGDTGHFIGLPACLARNGQA